MSKLGFPESVWLEEFAWKVRGAFGGEVYHVGSSVEAGEYHDVDVRLLLQPDAYAALLPGCTPETEVGHPRWLALCQAFSLLGRQMTGLKVDFQIQRLPDAMLAFSGWLSQPLGRIFPLPPATPRLEGPGSPPGP